MPTATPPGGPSKPPQITGATWSRIKGRANTIGSLTALFLCLLLAGGGAGYFIAQSRHKATPVKTPAIQSLSPDELKKLSEVGANLGTAGQTLNIAANALFRGKIDVASDLSIGGRLNANGPVTLSQLNITGTSVVTGLNVGSNLNVSGNTTLQKGLTANDLVNINSNLNVTGAGSFNTLNTNSLAVRTIAISGPLSIAHLATQGPTPNYAPGAVGAGGTVSISGNDTAGTININTGSGPGAATTLMTVTFRAAYATTPHVLLTPHTAAAATASAFVVPSAASFRILAAAPPAGSVLSFDYLVVQ